MPRKPKGESYDRLPKGYGKQVGTSISHQTAASVYGFLGHPEYLRLVEYERALTTDDAVGTGIEFIKLSILASIAEYTHPNPRIRDFVNEALARMNGNWKLVLGEIITSAMWAGFGVSETIYKAQDGFIWIDYIANYNPKTVFLQVNPHGQLTEGEPAIFNSSYTTGIWQDRIGGSPVQLPMNRICLVSHNRRYNNYYGESALKRIYKNWRLKDAVLEMWATALDRYGTPITYAIGPAGYTGRMISDPAAPGGQRQETIADTLEAAIANIGTSTGIVAQRPSPQDDIKLGTLTTGNNFGSAFNEMIDYLNASIYRGMLIPQLLLSEQRSGFGAGALAAIHFEMYKLLLQELRNEIVQPFLKQVIGPLIMLNFGDPDPGSFEQSYFDSATLELLSGVFTQLVTSGIVDNTSVRDLNMLRARLGLPLLEVDDALQLANRNYTLALTAANMQSQLMTLNNTTPVADGGTQAVQQQQIVKQGLPLPPKPRKPKTDPHQSNPLEADRQINRKHKA